MAASPGVHVSRIYDEPDDLGGIRVLVDRIWPRGVSKDKAALDAWCKQIAPSTRLRTWYAHEPKRFDEFKRRYHVELQETERAEPLRRLRELAAGESVTLLTATRRVEISAATVLAEVIEQGIARSPVAPPQRPGGEP